MPIQNACPGCGKLLSVGDEFAGRKARCPACGAIFTVPAQSPTSQPSPIPANPFQSQTPGSTSGQVVSLNVSQGAVGSTSEEFTAQPDNMFWMRATDGNVYGPTDRENLNRWFREGRVGTGYQIRQGESGLWEEAAIFKPDASTTLGGAGAAASGNPYAAQLGPSSPAASGVPLHKYPKADRGVIVLVMGILSFAICFVFGIVAIVMGRAALNDISAGLANPNDKPLVQIGFWLGVASLVLNIAVMGFAILMIALSAASQI